MNCPFCSLTDTRVMDSRLVAESNIIKRRRKCDGCGKRFTTFERAEFDMPMVIKSDKRREPYDRTKVLNGIKKACQKRPVALEQIEKLISQIEKALIELDESEVSARIIGNMVMEHLRKLDPVAYVRFASVYKRFQDIDEFVNDLKAQEGPHA